MEIIGSNNDYFTLKISDDKENVLIDFSPASKSLIFKTHNKLSSFLLKNEFQFRKLLHCKRADSYYTGFTLNFVITDNKNVADFNDKNKIIVLDKRTSDCKCYGTLEKTGEITEIFTDACYLEKKKRSGFVALLKGKDGLYKLFFQQSDICSNNLAELCAVILGIKSISVTNRVRIVTDSKYVKKGITEWIHNWKLNNWTTANGHKVKNRKYWQEFDRITENRYIEFQWIKGHANHPENLLCDFYAREAAEKLHKRKLSV